MPAFLLHATASDLLARRRELPERFARAFASAAGARRLGAVFVDLPYFTSFPLQVARHLVGRVSLGDPWGHVFHTRGVGRLALASIAAIRRRHLDSREDGAPAIAFLGGYLSHHAMDRLIHPVVQRHVREALAVGGGWFESHHTEAEKYQSLFFHEETLGRDIMGSAYPREITATFPGASPWAARLPDELASVIENAIVEVHARTPGRSRLNAWLRWTTWYGQLLSSGQGWREGIAALRDADALRRRYYTDTGIASLVDQATELTLDYLRAADEALAVESLDRAARRRFLGVVPDLDLDVGA